MALLDTFFGRATGSGSSRRPPTRSMPPPLPVSALIDEVRADTAIDHTLDAIEAGGPKAPKRNRRATDSQPTPSRCDSGAAPTPRRRRSGGTPKGRRKPAAPELTREQLVVRQAANPREHAIAVMDYLFSVVGCEPGDQLRPGALEEAYALVCEARGWLPAARVHYNALACQFRLLCGGQKTYPPLREVGTTLPDGTVRQKSTKARQFILPAWTPGGPTNVTPFPASRCARRAA